MVVRVGINGFGRIGRAVLRIAIEKFSGIIDIVAINDLAGFDQDCYLLKYDSIHGIFPKNLSVDGGKLKIDGLQDISLFSEKDPSLVPWGSVDVDCVIESTGRFNTKELACKHLQSGAKRVVISAPPNGSGVPVYVFGVNHTSFDPTQDFVISTASCTTNCLATLAKVLVDHFGIDVGVMTTIHAATSTQFVQDGPSHKNFRLGRSVLANVIPTSTGAADMVGVCLPAVAGKLTAMAFRVPTGNVSVVDLSVKLTKFTDYDNLCSIVKYETEHSLKGIMGYTEEMVVSSDFNGDLRSGCFDAKAGFKMGDIFKLISWYDNEYGYVRAMLDFMKYAFSVMV